jgi:hypothetical protein
MSERSYWLDLFSWTTWDEFLKFGGLVSGFRMKRWKAVSQIKPGDYLLCYLIGAVRFVGILEVVSEPYQDNTKIWEEDFFPCRVKVKIVADLTPETGIPVTMFRDELTLFQNLKSPSGWVGLFRHSPAKLNPKDGEVIVKAILKSKKNPVTRPFNKVQLARRKRNMEGEG